MYRCDICNKTSKPREKMNKIVLNRRDKEYYIATFRHKRNGNKMIKYSRSTDEEIEKLKRENWELSSEKQTKGWEINQEMIACDKCNRKVANESNNSRQQNHS